ncbi:MAG TPA: TonB family protein [Terriglobales bacterium]|nr:TonB family protein [Terriglobales bacterium]
MAVLQARSNRSEPSLSSLQHKDDVDEPQVLATLRELVAAGEHHLDPMLAAISDAGLMLTGATGLAIAMWKDGAMVCRARSGETAPPLGARLSADTGISGECLRTGKIQHCVDTEKNRLVDVEVCRTLGLRSIAVIPIQGERGNNGILEAFATEPGVFSAHHLAVLEHLAALAERARAAKPVGASPVAPRVPVMAPAEKPGPAGLMPASDRFVDFVRALTGGRPIVVAAVGVVALALLGLVIWLGWRGGDGSESKAHAAAPVQWSPPAATGASTQDATSGSGIAGQHVPDNDAVWKPNPGGQLLSSNGKPSAARSVKAAEELDAARTKKNKDMQKATGIAEDLHGNVSSLITVQAESKRPAGSKKEEVAALEPPPLAVDQSPAALKGVLPSQGMVPTLSQQRVSRGVSGGELIHRVPPVYPQQAKSLRLEGKVVLDATVMEDGTVNDLKAVEGSPVLIVSAMDAVKKWRYKPFMLDGKAIKSPMRITVDFKLPR